MTPRLTRAVHGLSARVTAPAASGSAGSVLSVRQVVVTAVHTAPAAVDLDLGGGGDPLNGVPYLSSYAPAVGDTAWLAVGGPGLLFVLGALAG